MGFGFSVLYFLTYYLTSPVLFGPLAEFRMELILAVVVLFLTLPKITGSIILKTPQTVALAGLAFATSASVLFASQWLGGAARVFPAFLPCALAYFLVCLHCNSKRKLQAIVLMLLFACLFVIANGSIAFLRGVPGAPVHNMSSHEIDPLPVETTTIPYLFAMRNDAGELFYRLKGQGFMNDPNDFGQLVVCVIPLVFVFWRTKRAVWNFAFVILPVGVLLYGTFLTHSRGALIALVAMAMVAARHRIGTLPALLLAGGVFVGAMAMHFTGGRDITASAGADRTQLWSEGLQMLKSHPLFGVGPGSMGDLTESHHTAHNSVVVCAAELGMFGLFFWCLFLFPTLRDALALASPEKVGESEQPLPEEGPLHLATSKAGVIDKMEINRLGRSLLLSLTGLLVAGWFLSRAYVMTLFLLGGMVEVVYEMAMQRGMIAPRMRMARALPYAGGFAVFLVLVMYIILRILNLAR